MHLKSSIGYVGELSNQPAWLVVEAVFHKKYSWVFVLQNKGEENMSFMDIFRVNEIKAELAKTTKGFYGHA
jgi:hypothetical protein